MTLAALDGEYLRALRHDFRHYYGCAYEDVPPDEAVDLIMSLPPGSAFVAKANPALSWSPEIEALADVRDTLWEIAYARAGVKEEPYRVPRPRRAAAAAKAKQRAAGVRGRIEGTKWVDVGGGL